MGIGLRLKGFVADKRLQLPHVPPTTENYNNEIS